MKYNISKYQDQPANRQYTLNQNNEEPNLIVWKQMGV